MNSVIFFFLSIFAGLTGADPCEDTDYADSHADECTQTETVKMERSDGLGLTDISNGF